MFQTLQTSFSITFTYFFNSTKETNFSEIFTPLLWVFLRRLVSARRSLNLTLLRILPLPEYEYFFFLPVSSNTSL